MARRSLYLLAAVAVTAIAGAALAFSLNQPRQSAIYSSEEVEFRASDNVRISATFYTPNTGQNRFKTLILIHEYDDDRHQWDRYVPRFIKEGYAVLAYDIRGFGKSEPVLKSADYFDTLVRDVEGAISWLKKQPNVDSGRIGVVGALLGGDVAFGSSGLVDGIKATVAISPGNVGGLLAGENVDDFHPRNILVMTTDTELVKARTIFEKAEEPKEMKIYRPESPAVRASGIALLFRDLRALDDLVNWLNRNI